MTEYEKFVAAEKKASEDALEEYFINIEEVTTGKTGVANTTRDGGVAVFYGNEDGSDDKDITADEFNRDFRIISAVSNFADVE